MIDGVLALPKCPPETWNRFVFFNSKQIPNPPRLVPVPVQATVTATKPVPAPATLRHIFVDYSNILHGAQQVHGRPTLDRDIRLQIDTLAHLLEAAGRP